MTLKFNNWTKAYIELQKSFGLKVVEIPEILKNDLRPEFAPTESIKTTTTNSNKAPSESDKTTITTNNEIPASSLLEKTKFLSNLYLQLLHSSILQKQGIKSKNKRRLKKFKTKSQWPRRQ